jgi:hypothetical protein
VKEARQVALNVSGGLLVVATVVFLGYFSWGILNKEIPISNRDAVMLVLGGLLAKYSDLISYFFGSSHTNKQQTETLDKMADAAKTVAQTAAPTPTVAVSPGEQVTVEGKD